MRRSTYIPIVARLTLTTGENIMSASFNRLSKNLARSGPDQETLNIQAQAVAICRVTSCGRARNIALDFGYTYVNCSASLPATQTHPLSTARKNAQCRHDFVSMMPVHRPCTCHCDSPRQEFHRHGERRRLELLSHESSRKFLTYYQIFTM